MKWSKHGTLAISECGRYEIRISHIVSGKPFYNAWRTADDKHIEASFEKSKVKDACKADAEKLSKGEAA